MKWAQIYSIKIRVEISLLHAIHHHLHKHTHTHTRKQMDKYKKTEKEERTYASYQHMNPNVSPHYECRPLTMKLKSKNITRSINVAFIQGEAAHCVVHVRFFNTHKKRTHFLLFLESNEILTNYKKWT